MQKLTTIILHSRKVLLPLFVGILVLIEWSCTDPLPVYSPPQNIIHAQVIPLNSPTDTVRYFMEDNNNPDLVSVRLDSPLHGFEIQIINTYEETIQDAADIRGYMELIWEEQPEFRTEIPVDITSFYSYHYDPVSNIVSGEWAFTKLKGFDGPSFFVRKRITAFFRYHYPMSLLLKTKIKIVNSLSYVESNEEVKNEERFLGWIESQV